MERRVYLEGSGVRIGIGTHDCGASLRQWNRYRNDADSQRDRQNIFTLRQIVSPSGRGIIWSPVGSSRALPDDSKREGSEGVVNRHYQRVGSSPVSRTNRYALGVHRHPLIRNFQLVCHSALSLIKKVSIPFAVISTVTMLTGFKRAEAVTTAFAGIDTYKEQTLFPNPFEHIEKVGTSIYDAFTWMKSFDALKLFNEWSVNIMVWVYKMLNDFVLHTPLWIFNHTGFKDTMWIFSVLSVSLVTLGAIWEGIKRMLSLGKKQKTTSLEDIMKRFPVALLGAGLGPVLFVKAFTVINWLSSTIGSIGFTTMKATTLSGAENLVWLDVLGLFVFDLAMIGYLFPVLLQNGRRFFDLICLNILTPFALSAWVFDRHRNLFNQWWNGIKSLSFVQVIHSLFICLLGVLIFATPNTFTGGAFFFKLILIIGGLWRMGNPPRILQHYNSDYGGSVMNIFKGAKNAITLRNHIPFGKMKNTVSKKKSLIEKRLASGKRYNP